MGKAAATRVIEYLEPSMSQELLCKFPDDSAFGFDYAQSGIWSPLVPRGVGGGSALLSCPFPRRLFAEGHYERVSSQDKAKGKRLNKLEGKIRKKLRAKGGSSKKGHAFSAEYSASPTPKKGWGKLLKSAAKRFIRQRRTPLHLVLPPL